MHINFEFKAGVENINELEALLQQHDPFFVGEDHQVDTYFHVPNGRLKLREGLIENALIHYQRQDRPAARQSDVTLYKADPTSGLKEALVKALGVKVVVDKKRKIYFIDNVKFHFDRVEGLGNFIEVEAIDSTGDIGLERLKAQCNVYAQLFGIREDQYLAGSYSDMLVKKSSNSEMPSENLHA